ncbi:hypothetical protein A3A79_00635 [Candidatus Gottesmanbacteria bacterium RIFCSPLOWO2_01_FULL_43_11b]|uniref:Uncharacterized protein n=1 Tax=Candidatus Gottesmanbacteria bacterium RIFCSPLOWO2_01_FULL_43_11b TaxID=1798392 RepID=A0A1F6AG22_9BACT|nr:MAG: hypothetical protein A3A79_00635 [Candidatus Gottesmanbacteria bacterium RIFCSPLOWO2_01_FULL_43_11b]
MTTSRISKLTQLATSDNSINVAKFLERVDPYIKSQSSLLFKHQEGSKPFEQIKSGLERAKSLIPEARRRLGLKPEAGF